MALYWYGGSGNWSDYANHWSNNSGNSPDSKATAAPTSGDDVIFDSASHTTSYTVTLTAAASCRDMTWGNPASGSPTLTGAYALSFYGNVSLVSGMTWSQSGDFTFAATSGTKTLTTNTVSMASRLYMNGNGGTLQLADNLTITSVGGIRRDFGTLDATTNSTTLSLSGTTANALTLNQSGTTLYNLTVTGGTNKTSTFNFDGSQGVTVSNNLTINGNSAVNRVLVASGTIGSAKTITCGNTKTFSNVDFRDITWNSTNARTISSAASDGATGTRFLTAAAHGLIAGDTIVIAGTTNYNGAKTVSNVSDTTHFDIADAYVSSQSGTWTLDLNAITGGSGNCGGNTGFTFTTARNLYWRHGVTGSRNWSENLFTTSPEVLYGETLTNGALTSGTSWTQSGDCALTGNAATWTYSAGTSSYLQQVSGTMALATVGRAIYRFDYTVSGVSGSPTAYILSTQFADGNTYLNITNGAHTTYFISENSGGANLRIYSTLTAGQAFTLDDLSMRRVNCSIPLPQDTVYFDASSFPYGSLTVTQDMPRIGSVDFTDATNTPTWTTSTAASCFGSITLISGMTLTASTQTYTFEVRTGNTAYITCAGKTWDKNISIVGGGTLAFSDAFTQGSSRSLTVGSASSCSNAGGYTFTGGTVDCSAGGSNSIVLGAATWTLAASGSVFSSASTTAITSTGSTIKFTNTSSSSKTFAGNGKTYNNFWHSPGTGTGELDITGGPTFSDFKDDGTAAHAIKFTKSTTTVVSSWNVGTPSSRSGNTNIITLDTVDGAGTFQITGPSNTGIICNYLNIQRSVAAGTNTKWWAGGNSVNNNGAGSGWLFNAPPQVLLYGIGGY